MLDYSAATTANQEPQTLLEHLPLATTRKKKHKNKRRFSDAQIKLLESMFESESKLEPRKKVQLAGELGLHPRQVAIWFQNRRARWKSKQLERDYTILKANYDALASRFDSLKNEKQSLQTQFQKLSDLLDKPQDHSRCCGSGLAGNSTDGDSDNGDAKCEFEVKPTLFLEKTDQRVALSSDCEHKKNIDYFELKETDLMNMADPADGSLTSPEKWGSIDSSDLFDQSCSSSQWWEIWS